MVWSPSRIVLLAGFDDGTVQVLQMQASFHGLGCALNCDSEALIHVQPGEKDFPECGAPMQSPCVSLPYTVAQAPPLGTVKTHGTVLDERCCSFGFATSLVAEGRNCYTNLFY